MELAEELVMLEKAWAAGRRDIDTARKLLYVVWSASVEPSFVTGIDEVLDRNRLLPELVEAVSDSAKVDFESNLVLGHLIRVAPWFFGSDQEWLPKGQACFEKALQIASQEGRTAEELRLIESYVDATKPRMRYQPPPNNEGCYPDLFAGDSAYDEYFAWIFAGRQTASSEESRKVTSEVLAGLKRAERKETLAAVKEVLLSPLEPAAARVLSVFFALGLLISITSLGRRDVVIAHYASIFYVVILVRFACGATKRNLKPLDYLLWVGAFAAFRIVAEYL